MIKKCVKKYLMNAIVRIFFENLLKGHFLAPRSTIPIDIIIILNSQLLNCAQMSWCKKISQKNIPTHYQSDTCLQIS